MYDTSNSKTTGTHIQTSANKTAPGAHRQPNTAPIAPIIGRMNFAAPLLKSVSASHSVGGRIQLIAPAPTAAALTCNLKMARVRTLHF